MMYPVILGERELVPLPHETEKCEIICEYEGERISVEEAERREALYREEGRPCTLMVIESGALQIA